MIERVDMFRVVCDRCKTAADVDTDFYAWADQEQAVQVAEYATWLVTDGGQWCPECTTWDEDADERVPKEAHSEQG